MEAYKEKMRRASSISIFANKFIAEKENKNSLTLEKTFNLKHN